MGRLLLLIMVTVPLLTGLGCDATGPNSAPVAEGTITVVTYNVQQAGSGGPFPALDPVLSLLAELAPDLLAVQELPLDALERVGEATGLEHHHTVPLQPDGDIGVAILSRWPLASRGELELPGEPPRRRVATAVVDVVGSRLSVYAVHFSRSGLGRDAGPRRVARELTTSNVRSRQARVVAAAVDEDPVGAVVLLGDLNAFPGSGAYRILTRRLDDAFVLTEKMEGSFPMDDVPSPKIDHVLHSAAIEAVSAEVVERGPSDHYPIVAVLRLPRADAGPGGG